MLMRKLAPSHWARRVRHCARAVGTLAGAVGMLLACAQGTWAQAHLSPKGPSAVPIATPTAAAAVSRPSWNELTQEQREALAPLAPHWTTLSEGHRRKWIAISRNFNAWPADEKSRVHERMSAWAGLSAPERDQARLNYAEARKVDPDQKKARWEAYQALTGEERDKLAATVVPRRPGVATPVSATRGPTMVRLVPSGADPSRSPRVGVPASEVDHNTLLPQHLPAP
ncbi:DUF3106 domain-containing protein [Xylophilus sp. GOD-11R]|uniref:DUF3106 domain-containing protein n=1 Tax=Xylophilus sp. GOD-11R TaxID=3089814 RepID=UPI00298D3805|nr:DUF3106 domain-containing protein [Xylophilus sp. GOD-11R]WPB58774.1 DUF3106 domain-containing protein [Xylophilus sp. GOD-11R]